MNELLLFFFLIVVTVIQIGSNFNQSRIQHMLLGKILQQFYCSSSLQTSVGF